MQVHVRAEQQTPDWQARYAIRSGVEGTVNEFVHGHGMRRCRYRGQPKTHLQHVFTAIAVNIERLSGPAADRRTNPAPAADRLPASPGPAPNPSTEGLTSCQPLTSTAARCPTAHQRGSAVRRGHSKCATVRLRGVCLPCRRGSSVWTVELSVPDETDDPVMPLSSHDSMVLRAVHGNRGVLP
ncbi:transposase [Streptomyces sp. NPDC005133]